MLLVQELRPLYTAVSLYMCIQLTVTGFDLTLGIYTWGQGYALVSFLTSVNFFESTMYCSYWFGLCLYHKTHMDMLRVVTVSGKLLREKTLTNFAVLWLFVKVFSAKFRVMALFDAAKVRNPRKFSLQKLLFLSTHEAFSLKSFPLYGTSFRKILLILHPPTPPGTMVVHFLTEAAREKYELEKLWTLGHHHDDQYQAMQRILEEQLTQ